MTGPRRGLDDRGLKAGRLGPLLNLAGRSLPTDTAPMMELSSSMASGKPGSPVVISATRFG